MNGMDCFKYDYNCVSYNERYDESVYYLFPVRIMMFGLKNGKDFFFDPFISHGELEMVG